MLDQAAHTPVIAASLTAYVQQQHAVAGGAPDVKSVLHSADTADAYRHSLQGVVRVRPNRNTACQWQTWLLCKSGGIKAAAP